MTNSNNSTDLPDIQIGAGKKNGETTAPTFLFAHGAGAGMDSDFMEQVAHGLAQRGVHVIRFEFPYMQIRRALASKRPPDRAPKLLAHFKEELAQLSGPIVIGGKSMGGRMASLLASQLSADADPLAERIKGVIAMGYPFHPAGKPENLRTEHLIDFPLPMLIVQGTRDKLGDRELANGLDLSDQIEYLWLEDGDHDLKPRKSSGFTHEQHLQQAILRTADFIHAQVK